MQVGFDGGRAERGQVAAVGEYLLVCDDVNLRMVEIEPRGHLTVRHDVNLAHPRRVLRHRSQRVLELVVFGESTRCHRVAVRVAQIPDYIRSFFLDKFI